MTIVHLTGLCSNLIEFSPCIFSSFAMEMSSIWSVRGKVAVCTVIFVGKSGTRQQVDVIDGARLIKFFLNCLVAFM
jgi:hypothetical protein